MAFQIVPDHANSAQPFRHPPVAKFQSVEVHMDRVDVIFGILEDTIADIDDCLMEIGFDNRTQSLSCSDEWRNQIILQKALRKISMARTRLALLCSEIQMVDGVVLDEALSIRDACVGPEKAVCRG